MMGLRRVAVAATGAALLFVGVGVGAGPVEAKRPARVTVCHVSDEGVKAIRVAERAVPALLARGSALPGDPAGDNAIYGDDCSIVPVAVAGPLELWCDNEGGTFSTGPTEFSSYRARCDLTAVAPEDVTAKISAYFSICFLQPGAPEGGASGNSDGDLSIFCEGTEPLS